MIERADLTEDGVRELLSLHLSGMAENSPAESVFALDLSGLSRRDVSVWIIRRQGDVAAIGALREIYADSGEIKSMRTHPDHVRHGLGRRLLVHIIEEAHRRGYQRLSLETGSGPAFDAAIALYVAHGFRSGSAFGDYEKSDFNQFFHLKLGQ